MMTQRSGFGRDHIIKATVGLLRASGTPRNVELEFVKQVGLTKGIDEAIEIAAIYVSVDDLNDEIRKLDRGK